MYNYRAPTEVCSINGASRGSNRGTFHQWRFHAAYVPVVPYSLEITARIGTIHFRANTKDGFGIQSRTVRTYANSQISRQLRWRLLAWHVDRQSENIGQSLKASRCLNHSLSPGGQYHHCIHSDPPGVFI